MNLGDATGIFSIVVAVAAISLNNYYASVREKRKEFRSRLDDILNKIQEIEKMTVSFHVASSYNEDTANEIRWRFNRLALYMQSVSYYRTNNVSQKFTEFKKSATLRNFGESNFGTQSYSSEIVRDIRGAATSLSKTLMNIYDRKHRI